MLKRKALRILGVLVVIVIAITAVGSIFFNSLVRVMMRPGVAFDEKALPVAPDYEKPAAWTALPDRDDAADATVSALPAIDQRTAPADVFYIHPTTYVGSKWNGPIDDARLNADTDRVATRIQASAFNACCAIYGPRYRQANGTTFTQPSSDGQRAFDVAYADVARAFAYFLTHYHRGRPFIIASHSQGTALAERLLREEISNKPPRQKLVAAYLGGGPIYTAVNAKLMPDLPPCASATQTGCLIVWNARGPFYQRGEFEFQPQPGNPISHDDQLLCVNPLTWTHDEAAGVAAQNAGALFLDSPSPSVLPGFATAQCQRGTLVVTLSGKPPRDLPSRLLDRALGPGNYHPIEYQIFFVNLRQNAQARLSAFLNALSH